MTDNSDQKYITTCLAIILALLFKFTAINPLQ